MHPLRGCLFFPDLSSIFPTRQNIWLHLLANITLVLFWTYHAAMQLSQLPCYNQCPGQCYFTVTQPRTQAQRDHCRNQNTIILNCLMSKCGIWSLVGALQAGVAWRYRIHQIARRDSVSHCAHSRSPHKATNKGFCSLWGWEGSRKVRFVLLGR
jgi:ferredoxin-like protein FixX